MRYRNPSSLKRKNISVDPERIIFAKKRLEQKSEIVVLERRGDKTIVSNGQNTIRAEMPTDNIVITSLGSCKSTREAADFLSQSYG